MYRFNEEQRIISNLVEQFFILINNMDQLKYLFPFLLKVFDQK